jgi:streptogramin lyase
MNQKGKISPFVSEGLNTPRGMLLKSPILYVADMANIQAIDMMNERVVAIYPIEGAVSLSGIASDGTDNLFITDSGANCLFIFNPITKSLRKITDPLISDPTAIAYDKPRSQMMIVDSGNQVSILSYNIYSQEVSVFMDTAYSQLEGIAIDELGRIFFSAAKEEMIVMVPQEQNRFVPVTKKLRTPGSFAYNSRTKELVIPLTKKNRIHTQKID